MKFLLIIFFLITGCVDNRKKELEQQKITELQNIISAVEQQDFSIFDKYFSKEELYPVFSLQDTVFTNINHTNVITYSNNGEPLVYSNQYGILFYENSKPLVSLQEVSNISEQVCLDPKFNELSYMYTWMYNLTMQDILNNKPRNSIINLGNLKTDAFDCLMSLVSYFEDPTQINDSKNAQQLRELGNQLDRKLRIEFGETFNQYLLKKVAGDTFEEQRNTLANAYIKRLYPKDVQNTNGTLEVVMNSPVWYP